MEKLNAKIQIESTMPKPNRKIVTATLSVPQVRFESKLRVLTMADYKAAAYCLAEAFEVDPACTYFINCPDTETWTPEQKWSLHLRTFECIVYAHVLKGLAVGITSAARVGEFDAVALWMPPGKNMDDFFTMFRSGMWRLKWQLSRNGRARFFDEFVPLLHKTKERVMKERDATSWYLVYLGTKPAARGKGLGGRLVRNITEKADAAGLACYLESTNVANLPLYRRLGFETVMSINLKEEDIPMDIMVREPCNEKN